MIPYILSFHYIVLLLTISNMHKTSVEHGNLLPKCFSLVRCAMGDPCLPYDEEKKKEAITV